MTTNRAPRRASRPEQPQEPQYWRLFAAVPVTDEVRARMRDLRQALEPQGWPLRWVEPELAHLTVTFFGDTRPALVETLESKLAFAAARSAPFTLTLATWELLGPRQRPNVLSLSIESAPDDPDALARFRALATEVERQTAGVGAGGNQRPFKAHLTLARFKDPAGAPPGTLDTLRRYPVAAVHFTIDRLQLVRSVLSQHGPAYTVLAEWSLGTTTRAQAETLAATDHG